MTTNGFVNYYRFHFGDVNAKRGNWHGPGQKLFDAIKEQLGDRRIIAEDLEPLRMKLEH